MLSQELRRITQVDLSERVHRDVAAAKLKREQVQEAAAAKATKEAALRSGVASSALRGRAAVVADTARLQGPTAASRAAQLTPADVDAAGEERAKRGAHASTMANTARDLRGMHRAVPTWRKGLT
jgi:hypothetical protein